MSSQILRRLSLLSHTVPLRYSYGTERSKFPILASRACFCPIQSMWDPGIRLSDIYDIFWYLLWHFGTGVTPPRCNVMLWNFGSDPVTVPDAQICISWLPQPRFVQSNVCWTRIYAYCAHMTSFGTWSDILVPVWHPQWCTMMAWNVVPNPVTAPNAQNAVSWLLELCFVQSKACETWLYIYQIHMKNCGTWCGILVPVRHPQCRTMMTHTFAPTPLRYQTLKHLYLDFLNPILYSFIVSHIHRSIDIYLYI